MKEVTVKEFIQVVGGELVEVESVDTYGISVNFSKSRIDYDEDTNQLSFTVGNYNTDGIGTISFEVDECIESISFDEENGCYTLEFKAYMSEILISTTRNIRVIK